MGHQDVEGLLTFDEANSEARLHRGIAVMRIEPIERRSDLSRTRRFSIVQATGILARTMIASSFVAFVASTSDNGIIRSQQDVTTDHECCVCAPFCYGVAD